MIKTVVNSNGHLSLHFSSFTLWLMYTFVVSNVFANSAQIKVFGVSWAILLRLTLPLGIFFRFHACVHYGEAWKNVYQLKKLSAKVSIAGQFTDCLTSANS